MPDSFRMKSHAEIAQHDRVRTFKVCFFDGTCENNVIAHNKQEAKRIAKQRRFIRSDVYSDLRISCVL